MPDVPALDGAVGEHRRASPIVTAHAPALLYREPDMAVRVIRGGVQP